MVSPALAPETAEANVDGVALVVHVVAPAAVARRTSTSAAISTSVPRAVLRNMEIPLPELLVGPRGAATSWLPATGAPGTACRSTTYPLQRSRAHAADLCCMIIGMERDETT